MAFSLDSKVKDILKNPEAAAVLDKYSPDASKNSTDETGWWSDLTETGIFPAVGIFETTSGRTGKTSFRQSNNLQKRSSLQFGDCFFFSNSNLETFFCVK